MDGFSNELCVCCRTASKPNKPVQKTLDKLFVRGSAQLLSQARRLGKLCFTSPSVSAESYWVVGPTADLRRVKLSCWLTGLQSGDVSGCSNEFKSLMSMPTPGALQLKKHLEHDSQLGMCSLNGRLV